jgi:hypothetical protein
MFLLCVFFAVLGFVSPSLLRQTGLQWRAGVSAGLNALPPEAFSAKY